MSGVCPYCGGDIAIRNPTGECDHLKFPEYVEDLEQKRDEPVLSDDYPLNPMYIYVVNGRPFQNKGGWKNVAELKLVFKEAMGDYCEVRRCDIFARGLSHMMV